MHAISSCPKTTQIAVIRPTPSLKVNRRRRRRRGPYKTTTPPLADPFYDTIIWKCHFDGPPRPPTTLRLPICINMSQLLNRDILQR